MKIYKEKAKIYDQFIKATGKNYSQEADFITEIKEKKIGKRKIKILDIGSGTGGHALELKKKGFEVFCGDINKEMLDIAKNKTSLPCICMDMKKFSLPKKMDIITCMYNTIMYNQNIGELKMTGKSCYNNLNNGGLFIIQVTNPEKIKNIKESITEWDIDEGKIVHMNIVKYPKLIHYFIIIDFKNKDCIIDKHENTIFPVKVIVNSLNKVGFKNIEVLNKGIYTYFICQK
jgi:SAM-dependent methyltransferase